MTTTREEGTRPQTSTRARSVSAYRVGPVITMVAAVVGAVIMFGLGVLAGRVCGSVLGLHDAARTGLMLGFGAFFGLASAISSGRRHLPKR